MTMRYPITIAALCILVGSLLAPPDGLAAGGSERRAVRGATVLRIETRQRADIVIEVRIGAAPSLVLDGDSGMLPMMRTEVEGDTLRVWNEPEMRGGGPIHLVYTTPRLRELVSTGSARVSVYDLNGGALRVSQTGSGQVSVQGRLDRLDLDHTGSGAFSGEGLESRSARVTMVGSGSVDVGAVVGDSLRVNTTGSGAFHAVGDVRHLDAETQGSGGMNLSNLHADTASLSVMGSGAINAFVTQRLDAHGNGSGAITVSGNPAQRNISGRNTNVH